MQSLTPALKVKNVYFGRWAIASGEKFSGLNSKGFGYHFEFQCTSITRSINWVPLGINIEPEERRSSPLFSCF